LKKFLKNCEVEILGCPSKAVQNSFGFVGDAQDGAGMGASVD
jgi:hypothetical protein